MSFRRIKQTLCAAVTAAGLFRPSIQAAGPVKLVEFIADIPPTRSSHSSTIIETKDGLLAAWFGGSEEGNPDVGIWMSRFKDGQWQKPIEIARGDEENDGKTYPCFNPVFFGHAAGRIFLAYKVGPNPSSWWGRIKVSINEGHDWSDSSRLPHDIIGPVRNKPLMLQDGTWLCGASEENAGWRVHMELSADPLSSWKRTRDLNSAMEMGAIQPTILPWPNGRIQILARTKQGTLAESWSEDDGKTWPDLKRNSLPNPNSAIDAVMLREQYALLICNPSSSSRELIAVARSRDGKSWESVAELEHGTGEFSYPAVIQSGDGLVHITYTWKRQKIRHAVLDPALLPTVGTQLGVGIPPRK